MTEPKELTQERATELRADLARGWTRDAAEEALDGEAFQRRRADKLATEIEATKIVVTNGARASREYQLRNQRVFTSSANFVMDEILDLRPDIGGGRWRVIELLSRVHPNFARCIAEPLDEPAIGVSNG